MVTVTLSIGVIHNSKILHNVGKIYIRYQVLQHNRTTVIFIIHNSHKIMPTMRLLACSLGLVACIVALLSVLPLQ